MKNYMPQEIEVWYIIPYLRSEIAKNLISKKISQKKAAKILGVTESAVSQYVKNKRAHKIELDDCLIKDIENASNRLIKNSNIIQEMHLICTKIKETRILCKIHKKYSNELPDDCKFCMGGI